MLCNIAQHTCLTLGIKTVVFSLETSPNKLIDRIAASDCDILARKIQAEPLSEREFSRVSAFGLKLAKDNLRIESLFDCDQICSAIARHADMGFRLFFVDYIQIVNASNRSRNEPRTYAIGSVATALKQAAIKHNVCVVALAQLKRPDDECSLPSENDIADSDQIFRDADLLWLLHRPDRIQKPTDGLVIVAKNKDGETGVVQMNYTPHFLRWEERHSRSECPITPSEAVSRPITIRR